MFREIMPFKSQEESIQQIKNRPHLSLGNASDAYVSDSRSLLSVSLLIMETLILLTVLLVFYRNSRQFLIRNICILLLPLKSLWKRCQSVSCIAFYCYLRYYYGDKDVKNDWELKDYLNQLSGYGKVSVERSAFSSVFIINISCLFLEYNFVSWIYPKKRKRFLRLAL